MPPRPTGPTPPARMRRGAGAPGGGRHAASSPSAGFSPRHGRRRHPPTRGKPSGPVGLPALVGDDPDEPGRSTSRQVMGPSRRRPPPPTVRDRGTRDGPPGAGAGSHGRSHSRLRARARHGGSRVAATGRRAARPRRMTPVATHVGDRPRTARRSQRTVLRHRRRASPTVAAPRRRQHARTRGGTTKRTAMDLAHGDPVRPARWATSCPRAGDATRPP